jgi:hypothetical protein
VLIPTEAVDEPMVKSSADPVMEGLRMVTLVTLMDVNGFVMVAATPGNDICKQN